MKLIVIEGIDGSGKTTLAQRIGKLLSSKFRVVVTQEPFTEDIKQLLEKYKWKDQVLLALLFSADRRIHVEWMRQQSADLVISDRYFFSTIAYQSVGVDETWLEQLSSVFPRPDMTILLDVPVEVALKRLESKRDTLDFAEKRESLEIVRQNYLKLARKYDFKILDGTLSIDRLTSISIELVQNLLPSSTSLASPGT
ncbi:dTMP kinase [Metallosphaera hakonensis]|uniref:Probable thymidylate kinase n=1 Tax=Metallosphaera hakonensis JCM 8857 = DSM 7519 TaxID=1293036 RepID=A0A2U9IUC9_9CREN|nr:dTMP kinase [Metallosphaera hakonensis]AWR99691.1 dTMP kinase [Metallosphaera hakonensis JCM 8857 = DSM 7519]